MRFPAVGDGAGMDPDPRSGAVGVARLAAAAEVADAHVSDADGRCAAYRGSLARLVWHPCPQAEWARSIIDERDGPASDDVAEEFG